MAIPIKGHMQGQQPAPEGEPRAPDKPRRQLAAIMFTDLVGYSAMAHRDEALAIELLETHRAWVRKILPHHGGREIETVGDAFLIEFGSALAAVECAVAVQHRFAVYNEVAPGERRMQLRIGIHLGDVEHAGDKVMGDGVNIASRIHGMAQPGGICVSEDVQRAVRNRGGLVFTSMGRPKLKNIETPLELFEVHAGSSGRRKAIVAGAKRRMMRIPRWVWITVAIIAAANIFSNDDDEDQGPRIPEPPGAGAPARPDAPVAAGLPLVMVMPFGDKDVAANAAAAEGLHRAVIEQLERMKGIAVMSKTSVMRDPLGDFRKLAGDQGVGYVLVGDVEQADKRLRVTVQLVDTKLEAVAWNSEYERELGDLAAAQADIARRIAVSVRGKLVPLE